MRLFKNATPPNLNPTPHGGDGDADTSALPPHLARPRVSQSAARMVPDHVREALAGKAYKEFPGHRPNPGIDGRKIRQYRERLGMTQQECEFASGIKGWGAMEKSTGRIPRPHTIDALENVLGVPITDMLDDGAPPIPDHRGPRKLPMDRAREEGHAAGYADGYQKGYAKGREDMQRELDLVAARVAAGESDVAPDTTTEAGAA